MPQTSQTNRSSLIQRLEEFPASLAGVVEDLQPHQLDVPYGEGKWTIRQVVHHIADAHLNAFLRFKLILTEEKPMLKPYRQDDWASLPDSLEIPLQPSLLILEGLHCRWAHLLRRLPAEDWQRQGVHLERGLMSAEELIILIANHGEKHLASVTRLKQEKGW